MTFEIKGKKSHGIEGLGRVVDAPLVFGEKALEPAHLMKLAEGLAKGFPDRIFGTETGRQSAEWLAKELRRAGIQPGVGNSYLQEFDYKIGDEQWPGQNVVGVLRGSDPLLRDEYVIVSAHHDSQEGTLIGANDNASGCALVLALAQAFSRNPPKRSILFVTFDGEEALKFQGKNQPGRRGSKIYAANPVVPLKQTALMVNADMIGQPHLEGGPRNEVYQWSSRDHFAKGVLKRAAERATAKGDVAVDGYPEQHPQAQMFTTDAEPLYRVGVPIVNFLSGRDLDNHQPQDDMTRLIPERMAQYARLAYECVVEAANHPESLGQLKIQPGGFMPSYPLIKHLKSAGSSVIEEEALRLNDLSVRLPELRQVAQRLVKELTSPEITARAGVDWKALQGDEVSLIKEPVLHGLRTLRAGLVEQHREIDKNDVEARRPLQDRLVALGGLEDVLQGAIYLTKLKNKGDYYLQQIPARLGEILRGAKALGLDAHLDGVVLHKDVVAFSAQVNADRAVFVARETLWGLGEAVSSAAAGILRPNQPVSATRDPKVQSEDLDGLKKQLIRAGEALVADPHANRRMFLVQVMLHQQLNGLNKADAKWVAQFQDRNAFVDFTALIPELKLPEAQGADLLAKAQALQDGLQTPAAARLLLSFYGALTASVFGEPAKAKNLEDLRRLASKKGLSEAFDQALAAQEDRVSQAARASDAPELQRLNDLADLVAGSLSLARCFDSFRGFLKPEVGLGEVQERLVAVRDATLKLPGTEDARVELDFWIRWIGEYVPYEADAKAQSKRREAGAEKTAVALSRLWPEIAEVLGDRLPVDEDDRLSSSKVKRAVETKMERVWAGAKDPELEAVAAAIAPYFAASAAIATLKKQPSPKAQATLDESLPKLKEMLGRESLVPLMRAVHELEQAQGHGGLLLNQKERGAPLAVTALGAPQRGME
ncbi:MAG: M28 family peptidase [Deltaproteobacteria bacterium]|nr:M28 family peptidase [Deltaproteobacteria bacterium]